MGDKQTSYTFLSLDARLVYDIFRSNCIAESAIIISSGVFKQSSQRKSKPIKSAFSTT